MPFSFRDTANSISAQCYIVKELPVVIDDFHPCVHQEQSKMTATAQNIARNYGNRAGRGRLTASCDLMEAKPPQGNAIITAEFPLDIGESGTARCFTIELKAGDVDLQTLTSLQVLAADGTLQRCGFAYTEWLRKCFLCDEETVGNFVKALRALFEKYYADFRNSGVHSHGRVAENVAWLRMGFHFFLMLLNHHLLYFDRLYDKFTDSEKKAFLNCFIERIDIFPEALPSGRILRSIKFRFPVFFDGQEVQEIGWDNKSTLESIVCLTND